MKEINVEIEFTSEVLGTASADKELHSRFVASKAPDAPTMAQEVAALGVDEVEGNAMTVFPRDADGEPCLWDYQIRGFFKDACSMLRRVKGTESSKLKAYKKLIDGLVFVEPRQIRLDTKGMDMGECQRPLRAQTAQGERVALAHSEECPEGTCCTFEVKLLDETLEPALREWLDYGEDRGIGQWRNSGRGRFFWAEYNEEGKKVWQKS